MTTSHTAPASPASPAAVRYRVEVLNPHAHLFGVTLEIDQPARQQRFSLPVWIPGSYLVREFAQHLQHLRAECGGQPLALQQLNKNTWEARPRVPHPRLCDDAAADTPAPVTTLTLRYEVYAFDASVRTAYLDAQRGFFNPTSLCLRVHGHDHLPHRLSVAGHPHTHGWQVATGLPALHTDAHGFGSYLATNYDELADSPFELGAFWSGQFEVRGIPHRFVVSGAPPCFDGARLLADTQKICAAQIDFWHGPHDTPPFGQYVFLLHATQDGYGGLEHRNSTALICQRSDLPRPTDAGTGTPPKPSDGYTTLLGLISHEYFHTWNVKRLRPAELARYDYERENHTELLWFFEGFTSYYDDLFLLRTGLIDTATYLPLLAKTINQVLQTPGRHVQSVAQASFDAWTKYYRVQENTPNATVSYYTKGALIALCLDLTLRAEGHTTLDTVMRQLYQRCNAGPMTEAHLLATLKELGQRSFALEVADWVHGTTDLPLAHLLSAHGVRWNEEPAPTAQRLGLRVTEANGLHIKNVLRGSAAETAGLAAGDEWLAVELPTADDGGTHPANAWRVKKLEDVAFYSQGHTTCTAIVARDGRLLHCPLAWPAPGVQIKLERDPSAPTAAHALGWLPAP